MRKIKLLCALLLAWCPLVAQAERLNIVTVGGYMAVSQEAAREIYKQAGPYFKAMGLVLRVEWAHLPVNPCEKYHSYFSQTKELLCLQSLGLDKRGVATYFMLPPVVTVDEAYGPQTAWIMGVAFLCGNVGVGNAIESQFYKGVPGPSRIPHDATLIAHETAHMFCARHIDRKPNLLHPNANVFTDVFGGQIPVMPETVRQIKRGKSKARRSLYASV